MKYRSIKRDTLVGPNTPRITVTDNSGKYTEYNRAYPKRNSRCTLEIYSNRVVNWLVVSLEEYGESDGGNGRSKTISLTLDEKEGRAIYEMLKEIYGE